MFLLIGLWLGVPVLMRTFFSKQFFHFFGHHVSVIRDRDEADLFAYLRLWRKIGSFRFLSSELDKQPLLSG